MSRSAKVQARAAVAHYRHRAAFESRPNTSKVVRRWRKAAATRKAVPRHCPSRRPVTSHVAPAMAKPSWPSGKAARPVAITPQWRPQESALVPWRASSHPTGAMFAACKAQVQSRTLARMSSCLRQSSSAAARTALVAVRARSSNPSIERTFQRPLRARWPAAHVKR